MTLTQAGQPPGINSRPTLRNALEAFQGHIPECAHAPHDNPFVDRVLVLAARWSACEWIERGHIRAQAAITGWTPALRTAYDDARLSSEGLARELDNISLSTLRRELAAAGALPPGEIIRAARLALAERLLRETRLMVRDVARRAGYSSEKHFATRFSLVFGCAPSDYRRKQTPGSGHE